MSEPKSWLQEGASGELKNLLESAQLDQPSTQQLAALAAKLGPLLAAPVATAVGTAAAAKAGAAGAGTVAKAGLALKVAVVVGTAAAVGGAFQAGRVYQEKTVPPKVVERVVEKRVEVPVVVAPVPEPLPEVVPEPAPAAKPKPLPARPQGEAALLDDAMAALSAGNHAKALALVKAHEKQFAGGVLVQEREVIAIEALVKLGRLEEARARAAQFKKQFPTSTHLLKVESLVGGG